MAKKIAVKTSGKISVRQDKSAAGYDKRTKAVLAALGLGRIGKESVFTDANAALLGQVARVSHLVSVTSV